jgi:hypothetical protein
LIFDFNDRSPESLFRESDLKFAIHVAEGVDEPNGRESGAGVSNFSLCNSFSQPVIGVSEIGGYIGGIAESLSTSELHSRCAVCRCEE